MTTEPSRLAQLPGFDTAPDVYETPEIDDSTTTASTIQTSPRAPSEGSDTSEEEDNEEEGYGVSRRRLYPERARDRFRTQSRGVDAKGVDLSDRVDGKRKGYKLKRAFYDDDEDENLEARLARLRREVEECRALAEAEKQAETEDEDEDVEGEGTLDDVDALSKLLAGIDVPPLPNARKGRKRRGSIFHDAPTTAPAHVDDGTATTDITDEQTLNHMSAFDGRLSALETALGISSVLENAETLSSPLLPSLSLLDNQLAALTSTTSLTALEAVSSRINKLKGEAQQLYQLQIQPAPADEENEDGEAQAPALLSPDDMKKLHSLYTILPNLQALSPSYHTSI